MNSRKAGVRFIFATILLDAMGLGLVIPTLPDLFRHYSSDPATVVRYYGYFIALYSLMQFLSSPVLGALSDRYGRRPVLLIALLGAGIDYFIMAFAPWMWLLFVGRIIAGLTGANYTVASAYMADISDDSNRSNNFGIIGAGFGLGFILGPVLGGLLGSFGPKAPFMAAGILNLINCAFGYFILPESLPIEARRNVELAKLNPLRTLMHALRPSPILGLIWVYALIHLAGQVHPSNWTLYTQTKFGWTSLEVGLSISFVGMLIALSQGGLTRIIVPRLGELKALKLGMTIEAIGFLAFALATKGWMMYLVSIFWSISGVATPALQSMIAREVPPQEQGELQGALMSLVSATAIAGPLLYSTLFEKYGSNPDTNTFFPGVAYTAASAICAAAVMMVFSVRKSHA